jgi:aspartate racemase
LETAFNRFYNQKMNERNKQAFSDRMIGILGGMGPEATLDLYRHIIDLTPATRDQDHIRVLIYSNPKIPDRTLAIAEGGESPLGCLVESAKLLEKGGAGIIAMPCNAAHCFIADMQREIGIPILDMIDETRRTLCEHFPEIKTAGLIATLGTISGSVYHKSLERVGIDLLVPDKNELEESEAAIANVKAGIHHRAARETFHSMGARLVEAGAEVVILGCTEIPLAFDPGSVGYAVINPGKILAEAAVDWALGKRE